MKKPTLFERMRRWVLRICLTVVTGMFYGGAAGIIIHKIFPDPTENELLIFVFFPVAIIAMVLIWPRIPKIVGIDD